MGRFCLRNLPWEIRTAWGSCFERRSDHTQREAKIRTWPSHTMAMLQWRAQTPVLRIQQGSSAIRSLSALLPPKSCCSSFPETCHPSRSWVSMNILWSHFISLSSLYVAYPRSKPPSLSQSTSQYLLTKRAHKLAHHTILTQDPQR